MIYRCETNRSNIKQYLNPFQVFLALQKPQFILWSDLKKDGYNLELLFLSSHTGTHLDAPYHFVKNGLKINQIPLDRLIGKATVIKLKKAKNDAITKLDITLFEKKNRKISNFSSIFFFTGWQKNLKKDNYFTEKSRIGLFQQLNILHQKRST